MLFINLKTYENGTGEKALAFIKEVENIQKEVDAPITILAQATDIRLFSSNTNIPIWTQHIDNVSYGKNTGWILANSVMQAGAKGSMINHAEHKIPLTDVSEIVEKYESNTFGIMISATSNEEITLLEQFKPKYISYEPQEYIGTKISVIDAASDLIQSILQKISTPLVIGAGIHKPEHIVTGIEMGVHGFLISSDVLLSENPIDRIKEYMLAYKDAYNSFH